MPTAPNSLTTIDKGGERELLPLVHPGEVLFEDFLKELGMSQKRLARSIGVPPRRINEIVHGTRAITADTALRLGRFFGTSPEFWMNLQTGYELRRERRRRGDGYEREIVPLPRTG
jgi:addiction module HigA family antidote